MTRPLFGATLALSSFLLFLVQPMAARAILPWFGGSASIWTACMLFFQSMLVLGYLYAHGLARFSSGAGPFRIHAGLLILSALVLPPLPGPAWEPADLHNPSGQIALLLLAVVGLPYLTLSTTAPLLQAWHARLFPERSAYRLYAWSNASSLLALICYPVVIEPFFTLRHQGLLWSALYLVFAALCLSCARAANQSPALPAEPAVAAAKVAAQPAPGWSQMAAWLWLPLLASVLLLGTTNELCHEITVMPFLWVGPLAVYLMTFVLCFQWEWIYQRWLFLPLSVLCIWSLKSSSYLGGDSPLPIEIGIWFATLFVFCMICHGELVRRKPGVEHLTLFYVAVALGGALGGVCVALLAPQLFSSFRELPLALAAIVVTAGLILAARGSAARAEGSPRPRPRKVGKRARARAEKSEWPGISPAFSRSLAMVYLAVALVMTGYVRSGRGIGIEVLDQRRNFFGVLRVETAKDAAGFRARWLYSGPTAHGAQIMQPQWARMPTTYFSARSGIGLALSTLPRRTDRHIGVLGLGAGTLAAYGQAGDRLRFYEINPLARDLAQQYFTYLSGCPCRVDIVMGDGRVSLAREAPQGFDLLALDAFTGDAPPPHLLTAEALQVYLRHLRPDGILAVNISNAYFDFRPVLRGLAEAGGLSGMMVVSESNEAELIYGADWVLLSRDPGAFANPLLRAAASPAWQGVAPVFWTDDFISLPRLLGRLSDVEP